MASLKNPVRHEAHLIFRRVEHVWVAVGNITITQRALGALGPKMIPVAKSPVRVRQRKPVADRIECDTIPPTLLGVADVDEGPFQKCPCARPRRCDIAVPQV